MPDGSIPFTTRLTHGGVLYQRARGLVIIPSHCIQPFGQPSSAVRAVLRRRLVARRAYSLDFFAFVGDASGESGDTIFLVVGCCLLSLFACFWRQPEGSPIPLSPSFWSFLGHIRCVSTGHLICLLNDLTLECCIQCDIDCIRHRHHLTVRLNNLNTAYKLLVDSGPSFTMAAP
ncbi:hypothetical protein EJ05DRAFT_287605 [Pseudovirgaria hyperparasitica]|uniref:Uncharacterized protein n=1 Tax=Pseudovirgaria hyperparasitica TaxID=470096 RepID=A0A6A6WCG1_9PEZI|nr:uncharacterized protein EJ05DRAFT_287605 [Pseudovirgaria hyperparasitica]KAF2760518.1 hypothetical protein EJ05DRAFT_287605 [Pseudovirgaria hyperparasitica]